MKRRTCRHCGERIELRRCADGRWRPFNLDGQSHARWLCKLEEKKRCPSETS